MRDHCPCVPEGYSSNCPVTAHRDVAHGRPTAETALRDARIEVIDAIEETFLAHFPSAALGVVAQEDVWAGLEAMHDRFHTRTPSRQPDRSP